MLLGELTQDVIRHGSFSSVKALVKDIESYLAQRNLNPKSYKWKGRGEDILRKIQCARQALEAQEKLIPSINGHYNTTCTIDE